MTYPRAKYRIICKVKSLLLSPFSLCWTGISKLMTVGIPIWAPHLHVIVVHSLSSKCLCLQSRMVERLLFINIHQIRPRLLVIVLAGLLISLFIECRANELNKNNGIILPNRPQQVLTASANISMTCIFIHSANITWTYPNYLLKTPEVRLLMNHPWKMNNAGPVYIFLSVYTCTD